MLKGIKYAYVAIVVCLALTFAIFRSCNKINELKNEIRTHERNEQTFINQVERYKTKDSLSCAKVGELELSLKNTKKLLADDVAVIENLNLKIKNMEQVAKISTRTETRIIERLKDTTITQHDTLRDIKVIDLTQPHMEIKGFIFPDSVDFKIITKDSLLIIETIEYKRFLGFLWKTKRIKKREFDVVSRNPNTIIEDIQVVTIKK